jgi:Flp pilus assembly protein TadD
VAGLAVLIMLLLRSAPAACHVTDTNMPDAVAETEYLILLEFQPEKTDIRNKLAMVLVRKKKLKEAEAELRKVLTTEPANFNALDTLGLVMSQTGRPAEAVAQFQAAIKANPQDVMVHYHLGQAQVALGDAAAAEKSFRQALELANQPGSTPPQPADLEAIRQALARIAAPTGQNPPVK